MRRHNNRKNINSASPIFAYLIFLILFLLHSYASAYTEYDVSLIQHATTAEDFVAGGDYDQALASL